MRTRATTAVRVAFGGRVRRLLAATAVLATATTVTAMDAPAAQAAVRRPAPVRVVLTGSTAHVRLSLVSDRPTAEPDHYGHQATKVFHGLVVSLPTSDRRVLDRPVSSSTSVFRTELVLPARRLRLGEQRWEVEDRADGQVTGILATVLRGSTVTAGRVTPLGAHRVAAAVRVRHYEPAAGGYRAAPGAVVQVQADLGGRWTTVTTWRADGSGTARGTATLPVSTTRLRFVRTDTLTDAGAVSTTIPLPS